LDKFFILFYKLLIFYTTYLQYTQSVTK